MKKSYPVKKEVKNLAEILWKYLNLNRKPSKADCILALGSHDTLVAEKAAELFLKKFAPYIIFSGGLGKITKAMWNKPEADYFAEIAIKKGVPEKKVIIENKSSYTFENITVHERAVSKEEA